MKAASNFAPPTAFDFDAERRKRLGQYFTGLGLGSLLAALAQADRAKTIIDPMAGSGDLLAACLSVGAKPDHLAGMEIDDRALQACRNRLPEASCLAGSAFEPDVLSRLPAKSWDLVIANPPYVRYQSFSEKADTSHSLPSAMQVRTGLMQSLQLFTALDTEDKKLFAHLVSGYSGLSDLAVPSWLLCAALVKLGGRLALVVPESWLSRDYAAIVHYLLFRWFEIEFVVEDEHASWFDDAQVKTTLIVAKRVKRRSSVLFRPEGESYCHIALSAAAGTSDSPIGRMALAIQKPEREFARQARLWLRNASTHADGHVRTRPIAVKLSCANVVNVASKQKWFALMGEQIGSTASSVFIPHEIHDWLSTLACPPRFNTFEACGIAVGQGLRTGANGFFYADGQPSGDEVSLVFGGPLAGNQARAPLGIARPVLRKQSELPEGFTITSSSTPGWILDFRRHSLPEDVGAGDLVSPSYEEMPSELVRIVRAAARANFGTGAKPQRVWELTAVAPNIKPASRGAPARHWYMLPDFAPRHMPDVLLPRVNAVTPKAYLNEGRECLVDANFSTMWILPTSKWTASALLALMNSVWVQAVLECTGAVMGGGALKVEATHLRRFPVPETPDAAIGELNTLGEKLRTLPTRKSALEILAQIDDVVCRTLGCDKRSAGVLREILGAGQAKRAKHNGKRGKDDGDDVC